MATSPDGLGFDSRSAVPAAVVMVMSWIAFWLDPVINIGPRCLILALSKITIMVLGATATSHLK